MSQSLLRPLTSPPPKGFRVANDVEWVQYSPSAPAFVRRSRRRTGRRAAGEAYERKVHAELADRYGDFYVPSVWWRYGTHTETRWCQTDGLLFRPLDRLITIIEVKLQHTPDAWWQVRHLYHPVLRKAFPEPLWMYNFCEVVKWYDPSVCFPEYHHLAADPLAIGSGKFGVHIWKS
jgi:hypothetical protein